jgi:hypothetical protein
MSASDRVGPPRGGDGPPDALGVPTTLVALMVAVALVVGAIVAVALAESAIVDVAAVGVLGIAGIALAAYLLAVINRTGVTTDGAGAGPAPVVAVGAGVSVDRMHAALVTALRDAHALQRGTRHVADAAAAMLRARSSDSKHAADVIALFESQRNQAADQEKRLEDRLRALGQHASRAADEEAIIAASLYERLLVRGVATNARHAYGLASLGAATYTLIEQIASSVGDEATRALAEQSRRDLELLAERWTGLWDTVLELDGDRRDIMLALLEEAHAMEAMRASLLAITARQARAAGIAAGAEDAGLVNLIALVDQERSAAADDRDLLRQRLRALNHHPSFAHGFETFAAARATALVEQIRSYKLVRDIRDMLAADRLETATYDLLARAAERAGDPDTAKLAERLRADERDAADRLAQQLDTALEIALLAE